MSSIRPADEFEAARTVVDVLKSLQPEEQARAIRWAQEKLGVLGASSLTADSPVARTSTWSGDAETRSNELTATLKDPAFRRHHAAVDKMLHLLSAASKLKPDTFDKILLIQGRGRRYFARSEEEIASSGKSTQPRKIPNTDYWVMTNSPTPQKREMLERALDLMGFSSEAVKAAVATIE
jgi:negative modulator of initiation of replication